MIVFFLRTLRGRMILYFCTIFIVFLGLLGGVTYQLFMNVMQQQILQYTEKIIEEKKSSIDSYFGQVANLVQISAGSQVLRDAINHQGDLDSVSKLFYQRQVSDFFSSILRFNSKIKDFLVINDQGYIYAQSGATIYSDYNFFEQPWFQKTAEDYFHVYFQSVHPQDYYVLENNDDGDVVSAIAPIYDLNRAALDRKVYLLCNLNVKEIESISNETRLEKTGYITILDQNNKPIYKPASAAFTGNKELTDPRYFQQEKGNVSLGEGSNKYLVVYTTLNISKWKVAAYIPYSEIYEHTAAIRYIVGASILAVIVLVVMASIFISSRINRPLLRLMKKMYLIENGRTDVVLFDNSTEEIEKLTRRIDSMISNIKALTEDNFGYKLQNKDMELKMLLSQINPHFLYNTLQSIKALAVTGKTGDISRMVTLIGNMLRYAINPNQDLVTIQEEVDHITNYLNIQNYRYPGKFRFEIDLPDGLRRKNIPKLVLQPIVENVILHAFRNLSEGLIALNVQEVPEGVAIVIVDNGKGMTEAELADITKKLGQAQPKDDGYNGGVGVRNVHQRIRNKYGFPYGIELASGPDAGTSAAITIPDLRGAR